MNFKELSDLLGVSTQTIRRAFAKLYPEQVENGIETRMTLTQSKAVVASLRVKASDRITISEPLQKVKLPESTGIDLHKSADVNPRDMIRLHRQALDMIESMIPKVEVYEAIASADGYYSMEQASKLLNNYGRNRLFATLRSAGILMANNTPYQTYSERGYFKVISLTRNGILLHQTFVTGKGIVWLQRELAAIESRNRIE